MAVWHHSLKVSIFYKVHLASRIPVVSAEFFAKRGTQMSFERSHWTGEMRHYDMSMDDPEACIPKLCCDHKEHPKWLSMTDELRKHPASAPQ